MPFSFRESDYRNTFPGEVTESVLLPVPNDPTREMWQLTILRLKFNAGKGDWEPLETPYPCQLPGCTIVPWHTHTRFYESDRTASPAHKFIQSIQRNTDIGLMGPQDLLNKRFTWEEEIWPSRANPVTGTKGKDQYYYFIKSKLGAQPEPRPDDTQYEPLPFDAPTQTAVSTTTTMTEAAPTESNGAVSEPEAK